MRVELLDIPDRRQSTLIEVIRFFRAEGLGWEKRLERFLQTFAGVEFVVPGLDFLRELERDEKIVQALEKDCSVGARIAILAKHKLRYQYLADLWSVCHQRPLDPPAPPGGRPAAIREAGQFMQRHPRLASDIASMYALTAKERADAAALHGARKKVRA